MYIYNVCMRIINKNSRVVRIKVRLEKSTLDGRTTREVRVLRTDMRFAKDYNRGTDYHPIWTSSILGSNSCRTTVLPTEG